MKLSIFQFCRKLVTKQLNTGWIVHLRFLVKENFLVYMQ